MADPILINLYIKSLGLTGSEADKKRKELEKLTPEELNLLISGKKAVADGETFGFGNLRFSEPYNGEHIFNYNNPSYGVYGWAPSVAPTEPKKYTPAERFDLRTFLAEFMFNSTNAAYKSARDYNASIGFFSIHNGVNNVRKLIGQETSRELEARLKNEAADAKNLLNMVRSEGRFEFRFERLTNIPFDLEKIEKLKQKSEEYTILTAFHEKYQILTEGIKHVKQIYRRENALNQARERGQFIPEMKESFEEEFLKLIDEFCNGDENLKAEYIREVSEGITNKKELNEKFLTCLDKLEKDCKSAYEIQLGGKTYEEHTKEFNSLYKAVTGKENPELYTQNYIDNSKQYALYGEIGVTIAASLLVPGSGLVQSAGRKLVLKVGEKAAAQIMKSCMTVSMGSLPAAMTVLDAATSKSGFTDEKKAEIIAKWKNGLVFGGLGAYVSGPIGNAVEKLLLNNPNAITGAVKQVFNGKLLTVAAKTSGVSAETTADVIIDGLMQNGEFLSSLETNGAMNLGMMIVGGRLSRSMAKSAANIKIQQNTDGTYSVKDLSGKLIFKAQDENILATFLFAKVEEIHNKVAGDADITMQNPAGDAAQKLQNKVGLRVDVAHAKEGFPKAPLRYDAPSKSYVDVLKHFDPKVMEKRYEALGNKIDDCISKHAEELSVLTADKQAFSERIIDILSKEFGMETLKPEVLITEFKEGDTCDGYWDCTKSAIVINKNVQDPNALAKMLSHEFRHAIQYKNLVVRYGEEGLKKLCETSSEPEKEFNAVMENPYTQRLLAYAEEHPFAKDEIDKYMAEIYFDEMFNYKDYNHPDYMKQIIEQEAYYLGNNRTHRAYTKYVVGADDTSPAAKLKQFREKFKTEENTLSSVDEISSTQNPSRPTDNDFTIDEFGQMRRVIPAGSVKIKGHISVRNFMAKNDITVGMMSKYIENKRFVLDENGDIDPTNSQNAAFLKELSSPSLLTKEEMADILGIDVNKVATLAREGKLVRHISNKYEMTDATNSQFVKDNNLIEKIDELVQKKARQQAEIEQARQENEARENNRFSMKALGRQIGVDVNTIKYHVEAGRLVKGEDGLIDLSNPQNKEFVENFKKGERKPKEKAPEPPVTMENVQSILGKLPLEYCIEHNLLVADKDGNIDFNSEVNKNFIQKVKDKEITVNDYFVSIEEFARRNGNTATTVVRAITEGKIKTKDGKIDVNDPVNIEYTKHFSAEAKSNPNFKSLTDIAKMLGLPQTGYLRLYAEADGLLKEPSGYYDISKEPNKSIIEGIRSGEFKKRTWVEVYASRKSQKDENLLTQRKIAEMKGITQATLSFHIARNHLVKTENGKIDITDPKNAYFIANFKKGEEFIPYEKYLEMQNPKATEEPKPVKKESVNPNLVTMQEFARMVGLTTTPMSIWMKKGAIVRNENKLFDLTDPKNKEFIALRQLRTGELYRNMSDEEIVQAKEGVKKQLTKILSAENYVVAKDILDSAPDKLDDYIEYILKNSVDIENLENSSYMMLKTIYKEILTTRINDKNLPADFSDIKFVEISSKLNIDIHRTLLEHLSERGFVKKPDKPAKVVKYLEFSEAKDGETPTEKEIKSYIEIFRNSSTVETFNELVETYNKCCGENRIKDAAENLLAELREFNDADGTIDRTTILECQDLMKEAIRDFRKTLSQYNASEAQNIKQYLENNDLYPELTQAVGFPKADEITAKNINEARLLRDIYKLHEENADIEGIEKTLLVLKDSFGGKISQIAEMYAAEPDILKSDLLNLFKSNDLKPLQNKLEIFESWKSDMSGNSGVSYVDYTKMRTEMNLSRGQIAKNGVNILSVLGYKNFSDFSAYVQNLPTKKPDVIFKVFNQSDVAGLKKYLDENKIANFSINFAHAKNMEMVLTNKKSRLKVSVKYKQGKDLSIEEHFNQISQLFENANGKITQRESENPMHLVVTPLNILKEIRSQIGQKRLGSVDVNHGFYKNILEYLGINTEGRTHSAILSDTYNLSPEQFQLLNILVDVLKNESFDSIMTGLHAKMRFVERFMLDSSTNIADKQSVSDFIDVFKFAVEQNLNSGASIDVYQSGDIIAPKFNVTFCGANLLITLNDKRNIHTLFEKKPNYKY